MNSCMFTIPRGVMWSAIVVASALALAFEMEDIKNFFSLPTSIHGTRSHELLYMDTVYSRPRMLLE